MPENQDRPDAGGMGGYGQSYPPYAQGSQQPQPMSQQMPYASPVPYQQPAPVQYQQAIPSVPYPQQMPIWQAPTGYQPHVQIPPQNQYGVYQQQQVPQQFVPYSYEQTVQPFAQMQAGRGGKPKGDSFSLGSTAAGIHMDIPEGASAEDVGNAFMQYLASRGGITIAIPELNIPYAIYFPSRNTAFTYCMLSDTRIALAGITLTRILIRPRPASRSARIALLYPAVAVARQAGGTLAKSSQDSKVLIDDAERKLGENSYVEASNKPTYGLYQDGYRKAARQAMLVGWLFPLLVVIRFVYILPMPLVMAYTIMAGLKSSKGTAPGASTMGMAAAIAGMLNPFIAMFVWFVWYYAVIV